MPIVCIERPNRTRVRKFTEKDAGRIVCRVVREGGDRKKLEEEIKQCLDLCDESRLRIPITQILEASQALQIALGISLAALAGVAIAIRFLSRIPLVKILFIGIQKQIEQVKIAIEWGRIIESTSRKVLDELPPPPP